MPFQSEKQRKYLWANEPAIARDWTDKYGSRVKKARGDIIPDPINPPGSTYKSFMSDAYQDVAAESEADLNRGKLSYADSPIYNRGLEAWDPRGIGSVMATGAVAGGNWLNNLFSSNPNISQGKAGGIGGPTAAGFAGELINPILSGNATPEQRLQFANTFGHELGHLGFQYKPKDERISVGGRTEGGGLSALMGSVFGDYAGDEQWNYMHDLMYAPRGYTLEKQQFDQKNLNNAYKSGKISRDEWRAGSQEMADKMNKGLFTGGEKPGEGYLTSKGLINRGDLSYTPKAHDAIAWSGLTSADKKALGFGVNPFEDTMMGKMPNQTNYDYEGNFRGSNHPDWWGKREFNPEKYKSMTDEINRRNAAFLNKDEDDPYLDRIRNRINTVSQPRGIMASLRNRFYKPATRPAGGYGVAQLNRMNALGGQYSEPAREQRRQRSRVSNMLARQAAGKSYSQKNLNQLTMGSRPGHYDPPGGGGAAADTSPSTPGNNPFGYR